MISNGILMLPKQNAVKTLKKVESKEQNRIKMVFLLIHGCFSLDFGYANYKSLKHMILIRIISLMQCLCLFTLAAYNSYSVMNTDRVRRYFSACLHYVAFVVTLLLSRRNKSFFTLQKTLRVFDSQIGVSSSYSINRYLILSILATLAYRFTVKIVLCIIIPRSCFLGISHFIFYLPTSGTDIVLVVNYFVFHCVYHRLKKFTTFVRDCRNIEFCQYNYKMIVDCVEKAKDTFDVIVSIN
jgi:hypothetical protein